MIDIRKIESPVPNNYRLFQNYPNPFNPVTTLKFATPKSSIIKISIYDILGKEIKTILNKEISEGIYEMSFDAGDLKSGTYFCRMTADGFSDVKRISVLK